MTPFTHSHLWIWENSSYKIRPDKERSARAVGCQLYEARIITKHDVTKGETFMNAIGNKSENANCNSEGLQGVLGNQGTWTFTFREKGIS